MVPDIGKERMRGRAALSLRERLGALVSSRKSTKRRLQDCRSEARIALATVFQRERENAEVDKNYPAVRRDDGKAYAE